MRHAAMVWVLLLSIASMVAPARSATSMILATTTSTRDTGLLDELVPIFEKETGIEVKVIAVGTGAALRMARKGQADAVFTHAPSSEKLLVEEGHLIEGRRIMHNDFLIVGPRGDPANARVDRLETSLGNIAVAGSFISRGDDSGTHKRELHLWKLAEVEPAGIVRREETGQGMGATLDIAGQRKSYTLTDRGTFLALRSRLDLIPIFQGHPGLLNVYTVYVVNPEKHAGVKASLARQFAQFMASPSVQERIGKFRAEEFGRPLFQPDANSTPDDVS